MLAQIFRQPVRGPVYRKYRPVLLLGEILRPILILPHAVDAFLYLAHAR